MHVTDKICIQSNLNKVQRLCYCLKYLRVADLWNGDDRSDGAKAEGRTVDKNNPILYAHPTTTTTMDDLVAVFGEVDRVAFCLLFYERFISLWPFHMTMDDLY